MELQSNPLIDEHLREYSFNIVHNSTIRYTSSYKSKIYIIQMLILYY